MAAQPLERIDSAAITKADANQWLAYGRDDAETHFSPLKQINTSSGSDYRPRKLFS